MVTELFGASTCIKRQRVADRSIVDLFAERGPHIPEPEPERAYAMMDSTTGGKRTVTQWCERCKAETDQEIKHYPHGNFAVCSQCGKHHPQYMDEWRPPTAEEVDEYPIKVGDRVRASLPADDVDNPRYDGRKGYVVAKLTDEFGDAWQVAFDGGEQRWLRQGDLRLVTGATHEQCFGHVLYSDRNADACPQYDRLRGWCQKFNVGISDVEWSENYPTGCELRSSNRVTGIHERPRLNARRQANLNVEQLKVMLGKDMAKKVVPGLFQGFTLVPDDVTVQPLPDGMRAKLIGRAMYYGYETEEAGRLIDDVYKMLKDNPKNFIEEFLNYQELAPKEVA